MLDLKIYIKGLKTTLIYNYSVYLKENTCINNDFWKEAIIVFKKIKDKIQISNCYINPQSLLYRPPCATRTS